MATLMIQGTTSDAGKSTVVAGLCRVLARRGVSVAPFKPQNMALNSAVTVDGGEIGRSTALQALAAGVEPHSDMNPVLLKPQSDRGAQVILRGRAHGYMDALEYHVYKQTARASVLEAWQSLSKRYEVIIAEGAGSPAEINLREHDIANMGFAEMIDCPVVLVGDIDRGGVFAQLVGTLALLGASERSRTRGFIVNRFRGDITLLEPGLEWLTGHTGKPVLGTLPYLHGLLLDAEDSIGRSGRVGAGHRLKVIVPALPRISNHNDFDPLRLHPQVELVFVGPGQAIPPADLIILPGSQSVRSDLEWLRAQGWETAIQRHLRYGGKLLGIGGGFQMLGRAIHDSPEAEGSSAGLGLLEFETHRVAESQLRGVSGRLLPEGVPVRGYMADAGVTVGPALERPLLELAGDGELKARGDGAVSGDGQVMGTSVHGLFDRADVCEALLARCGLNPQGQAVNYQAHRQRELDRLADCLEAHLDMSAIDQLLQL